MLFIQSLERDFDRLRRVIVRSGGTTASTAKPSVQTRFTLEAMADKAKDEQERWEKLMVKLELLTKKVVDVESIQQQLWGQAELDAVGAEKTEEVERLRLAVVAREFGLEPKEWGCAALLVFDEMPYNDNKELDREMEGLLEYKQAMFEASTMFRCDVNGVFEKLPTQVVWDEEPRYDDLLDQLAQGADHLVDATM